MPVAVTLGGDPVYTFAATAPLPDGLDELLFAGFLRKKSIELVRCKTIDVDVPGKRRDGRAGGGVKVGHFGPFRLRGGRGIFTVDLYRKVRLVCAEGMSQREAARHFGISRDSVRKMLSFSVPPDPQPEQDAGARTGRCEWIERRENVIALGPSGTGKTHAALGLGLAACQKGLSVGFTTAAALVHELMEARDERRLLRLQKQMAGHKLLIIDELGFVPLSKTGAELLFELISPALRARRHPDHQQPAVRRVDRDLRLRAPHRRAARPADPPRHHPRDERRQLPARPEPHEKNPSQRLTPGNPVGLSGQRALAHASYSESARTKARPMTQHQFPIPELADYCAAPWLVFPPPLTSSRGTLSRARINFLRRRINRE